MKVTIEVSGRGNELTVGNATKKIYDFFSEECGDDGYAYLEKLDSEEVPEDCMVQDGNVTNRYEFFDFPGFYNKYSINPYSDSFHITVTCDDEEVLESDDCESIANCTNDLTTEKAAGIDEDAEEDTYFYFYATDEEMSFTISFETDSFDISKLKMNIDDIDLGGNNWRFINSFEYDGKTYKPEDFDTDSKGDMFAVW